MGGGRTSGGRGRRGRRRQEKKIQGRKSARKKDEGSYRDHYLHAKYKIQSGELEIKVGQTAGMGRTTCSSQLCLTGSREGEGWGRISTFKYEMQKEGKIAGEEGKTWGDRTRNLSSTGERSRPAAKELDEKRGKSLEEKKKEGKNLYKGGRHRRRDRIDGETVTLSSRSEGGGSSLDMKPRI